MKDFIENKEILKRELIVIFTLKKESAFELLEHLVECYSYNKNILTEASIKLIPYTFQNKEFLNLEIKNAKGSFWITEGERFFIDSDLEWTKYEQ